ncbi:11041_t:CDS:2, partial [Dentiscutata heterogama]
TTALRYFKTALSNDWIRKEGTMTVFNKPNIDPYIFSLLLSFIFQFNIDYKKKMVAKLGRVIPACSQYAINDSQYHGPCFGDGDLWINDEFNLAGNCSCNKESYEQSVGDMFHRESWDSWNGKNGTFAVDDYEVFQVIKLRLSDE